MKYMFIILLLALSSVLEAKTRIVVSKNTETLLLIQDNQVILKSPISFGGVKTEVGIYTVGKMEELATAKKLSKELGKDVFMAHCLRFNGPVDGICLHQGDIETDSHGCIRCPRETALAIFKVAKPGMVMEVVDDFKWKITEANRDSLWVKSGVWKDEPTKHIASLLRISNPLNGGNVINFSKETEMNLTIAALVRGRSVIDSRLHEKGEMFEGLDKNVVAYIKTLQPTKSAFIRYLNKEKGTDRFLIWTGDSSIWVSLESVNAFIRKLAIAHGESEDRLRISPLF